MPWFFSLSAPHKKRQPMQIHSVCAGCRLFSYVNPMLHDFPPKRKAGRILSYPTGSLLVNQKILTTN